MDQAQSLAFFFVQLFVSLGPLEERAYHSNTNILRILFLPTYGVAF